ncbi:hypothetical protein WQ54_04755 [Bacillus sp. SA1-12]|uniref:hypothetical protein n=1 Tax=Bacillus sp. SA1-12 TaxID=1455638 RepID=UPI0006267D49|nr:hypothetical protein [Bacillus sp. SA1-12]KKI93170.1 hypothetical protein WQ54_04755 [Bacillus sp. SA1-12]
MLYQMKLFKGLFQPGTSLYQLQKAEALSGLAPRLLSVYLLSLLFFAISTYYGIGTESYSGAITDSTIAEYEAGKLLLLGGELASSLLYTTLFIWFIAFIFWLMLDISYMKAVIVQMFVFVIHLVGQAITIPVLVFFDLNQLSNPLSFGVIGQYIIDHDFWQHVFGAITLFDLLAISYLYYYLKNLTEKNKYGTLILIVFVYVFIWIITAFMSFLEIPVLVRGWL